MDPVTYSGHRARIDVDPVAGTITVTPTRRGHEAWTVPIDQIEAVGMRYSTLIKRGTLRLLVRGQTWAAITDDSPNAVAQAHAVSRGTEDDPFTITTAIGTIGIPMVPLDGKGRPAKIRQPGLLTGVDLSDWG